MSSMKQRHELVKVASQVAVFGLVTAGVLNYQLFLDQYALATFHPAASLVSIEGDLRLTSSARAIFYRAKPQIDSKTAFNSDCETSKGELELGCYYRERIYILQIENPSLVPEMQVVTAHELLHAAWRRMSNAEQQKMTAELERVYASLNDADLKQRMASYAKSEPGQEANELHSILGTEYAQLSPMLEQHYARYFTDRSQVVAAHASYEAVFNSRRQELEGELANIRTLKGQLATINRQLETLRTAGKIPEYNALVPKQNNLVDTINRQIDDYRKGVDEYNALSRSLDSQEITDTETIVQ